VSLILWISYILQASNTSNVGSKFLNRSLDVDYPVTNYDM